MLFKYFSNFSAKFALTIFFVLAACSRPDGPHQDVKVEQKGTGNTGSGVGYKDVAALVQAKCLSCHTKYHSAGNTVDWSKEENFKRVAANGKLKARITDQGSPMPPSGSEALNADEKALLLSYVDSVLSPGSGAPGDGNTTPAVDGPEVIRDPFLAALNRCIGCHGLQGESIAPNIPNLSGHGKPFFIARAQEFLKPTFSHSPMQGVLKQLATDFKLEYSVSQDNSVTLSEPFTTMLDKIASFYSNQGVTPGAAIFQQKRSAFTDEQMAEYNLGGQLVKNRGCTGCHLGVGFKPAETFPMIFGQKSDYLTIRLNLFKEKKEGTLMPIFVDSLSVEELKAITVYLSHTHPLEYSP